MAICNKIYVHTSSVMDNLVNFFSKPKRRLLSTGAKIMCPNVGLGHPFVIGHRGACGYVPEHTLASYALAALMGADYVEPDLVISKDHHLIACHDNNLGPTTDVQTRLEFASRRTKKNVDGVDIYGWFPEDFSLAELKTLRVVERLPKLRPSNARLNGIFQIPTFQEIIDLIKALQISLRRRIGVCPEIKHGTYFQSVGLPMEQVLVDIFHENGFLGPQAPAFIQSMEISNLKKLKSLTGIRLMQLFDEPSLRPFDQVQRGINLTYSKMATSDELCEIAKYAYAIGVEKDYIIPHDKNNRLGNKTGLVNDAHSAGLKVVLYTFRAENAFLSQEYIAGDLSASSFGNLSDYLKIYFAAGIDGIFCDHPDIAVRLRNSKDLNIMKT